MFPHPIFQVAGYTCVEYSLGFVGHDVEGGLFYDRCSVMDSRFRGNDGGDQRRNGGNPWLLFPFSMITLRHSRVGGNPSNTTAVNRICSIQTRSVDQRPEVQYPFPMLLSIYLSELPEARVADAPTIGFSGCSPTIIDQVLKWLCIANDVLRVGSPL